MKQYLITRLFPLCLLLLAALPPVYSQEVTGKVLDAEGKAVEFANLVLWDAAGARMLQYTTSDQNGRYRLPVEKWEGLLVVSSLGHQTDTLPLSSPVQGQILELDIVLQTAVFNLQSVEVSDSRIPYKTEGDTTTYQSEFFSDGTEQTVEELVKKLPGVSVADDGVISYRGKRVDKVLLEDDELFGTKYQVGTRSLRADVVDEIQFIDHYIDNPLLREVAQSDALAMNITIKEDRKKLLFGDANLGGGIPERYEGYLNVFSLYKKHKGILLGNTENTGSSSLDMYTLLDGGLSIDDPYEYSRPARQFAGLPSYMPYQLKRAEIKNGRIHQGAANLILNPTDGLKIKAYGLGVGDRWQLGSASFFRDLNLGLPYEYNDRSAYDERKNGTELNLETIWQVSPKSNMKYAFNLAGRRLQGRAQTLVRLPQADTIPQTIANQNHAHIHRLNWVGMLNRRQVIVLDAAYYADALEQDLYFDYRADENHQHSTHQVRDADLLASFLGKRGSLKYALSVKCRVQNDQLNADLSPGGLLQQEVELDDQIRNDYQQRFLALIGSFSTQIGIAGWSSSIEIGRRQAELASPNGRELFHTALYPDLHTGLDIRLSKRSRISLSGSARAQMPEVQQVFGGYLFSSFRSIVRGADRIDPYFAYSGILAFKHSNNAKLLEFSASGMYTANARAYVDRYFYQEVFSVRDKQVIDGGATWNVNAHLDKYLPGLSTNFSLRASGTFNRAFLLAADAGVNEVQLNTRSLEAALTTVLDGPLNIGIHAEANWSSYRQLNTASPLNSQNRRYGLDYFLTWKPAPDFFVRLNTRQLFTNNQGQQARTIYLGGLRSEYRLSNALRCGFTIHNLWNTRRFNLEQLGGETYSFNEWRLNPRMILANLGFRF